MPTLTELAKKRENLVANNDPIPDYMVEPDLQDILYLRKKPLRGSYSAQEQDARNSAYTFFVEHLLPRVAGVKGWKEEMCTVLISNTKMTASDEAFAVLCCENMWDKWHATGPAVSRHDRGRYTSGGSNRKFNGWSQEGLARYNELFEKAVINRNKKWTAVVEREVMLSLRARHYPCATLQDIRSQKSRRKRKRGPIEYGDPMGELPPPSWDTEAIEIPDSDNDEN